MNKFPSYYVVLDSNVWVTERLLQSSIGSALLYALTEAKASIILPEVVELEVNRVMPEKAERAVKLIKDEASLLRQLSGQRLSIIVPSALAINDGITHRWKELDGLFTRVPFTHDQAKSALDRIIRKTPPCGGNNEQFRDCCIWEAALWAASDRLVHLVTGDKAFYESQKYTSGLALVLSEELAIANKEIRIHPGVKEFLDSIGDSASLIDKAPIRSAILESVTPRAREILAERRRSQFELGKPHEPNIMGYATPKPSLIAVSFELSFDLERLETRDEAEARSDATLSVKGVCSYDPNGKNVSDIEIRGWSETQGNHHAIHSQLDMSQYSPSHMRVISS